MRWALVGLAALAGCTTLDLDSPRAYPCTADAECRGGWVCGLERVCHPPEPGPWLCASDGGAAPCFGWHCGLEGRCYSKDEPVARPCLFAKEADGGRDDCPHGFRCGRDDVCHERGDEKPWPCEEDFDCEGAWRCGPNDRCLDPSAEQPAFRPVAGFRLERLSPLALEALPDALSSDSTSSQGAYAWRIGNRLTRLDHLPSGFPAPGGRDYVRLSRATLAAAPDSLTVTQSVLWLGEGSKLRQMVSDGDGGLAAGPQWDYGVRPRGVRVGAGGVLAWSDTKLHLIPDDGGTPVELLATAAGEELRDVDYVPPDTNRTGIWVLTSTRLLHRPPISSSFTPVSLQVDGGTPPLGPPEASRAWLLGLGAVLLGQDGGFASFSIPSGGSPSLISTSARCEPCASGGSPRRPSALTNAGTTWLCERDGGVARETVHPSTCARGSTSTLPEPKRWTDRGDLAWADAYGRLGQGNGAVLGTEAEAASASLAESGGRLFAANGGALVTTQAGLTRIAFSGGVGERVAGAPGLLTVASAVTSTVCSVMDLRRKIGDAAQPAVVLATLDGPTSSRPGPGVLLQREGRSWLVVANDDTLFAGDVTAALEQAQDGGSVTPGVLDPRLVPSARLPVLAVVGELSSPDAGTVLSGWALATNRVVRFEALTERSWVDTPLSLPPGDWVTLLGEEGRYRVAYSDGRLFSLPSRLLVAEPFGAGVSSRRFVRFGGIDFALTDGGVRYLAPNPDGGPRGVWEPVSFPTGEPGLAEDSFEEANLFAGEGALHVLTHHWALFRVTPEPGSP